MDLGGSDGGFDSGFDAGNGGNKTKQPRPLPADLPRSLDDRRHVPIDLVPETEMYDGWQGASHIPFPYPSNPPRPRHILDSSSFKLLTSFTQHLGQSQFLTSPMLAKPLSFGDLTLNDPNYDGELTKGGPDSETRLMEMLAAQAAHSAGVVFEDEDAVAEDEKRSPEEKKDVLQKAFIMAASNGNVESITKILNGKAKAFIDVNAPDDEGTPGLIYASCFVSALFPCLRMHRQLTSDPGTRGRSTGSHQCRGGC